MAVAVAEVMMTVKTATTIFDQMHQTKKKVSLLSISNILV
jgi:hypothetical protein